LPVLARQTFHGNGGTYGLLSTMLSIGLVAGSLGVGLIYHPRRQYLVAGALAFGAFLAATAGAPDIAIGCLTHLATGATAFSFVTLCQPRCSGTRPRPTAGGEWRCGCTSISEPARLAASSRGRSSRPPGYAPPLLTGAAACLAAAAIAARVHTPPHADAALTDLASP
jgi:hypothetical protein